MALLNQHFLIFYKKQSRSKLNQKQRNFIEKCPYCQGIPELKDSIIIYQKSYGNIWICPLCKAYVGCHKGGTVPKGSLCNSEIRQLRRMAHALFDPLWKNKEMSRGAAYRRMAEYLNVDIDDAHISQINKEQLHKLIKGLQLRMVKKNEFY